MIGRPSLRDIRQRLQDAARERATVDAYPDHEPGARVRIVLAVFDANGEYTGEHEHVDTNGLSFRELLYALHSDKGLHGRWWLADRLIQAHRRLWERIGAPHDG